MLEERRNGPHIIIINDRGMSRGVTRYARDLYSAIGKGAIFVNLRYSTMPSLNSPGVEFLSSLYKVATGTKFDNILLAFDSVFFPLTLSNARKYIKRLMSEGFRVHYSSQMIVPIAGNSNNIVTIHDLVSYNGMDDSRGLMHIYLKQLVKYYSQFEHIVVDSNIIREGLLSMGVESDPVVLYPCASNSFRHLHDKAAAREKLNLPTNKTLVLSMGATSRRKNLGVLPEVMRRLGSNHQLVRIGDPIGNSIFFKEVSEETLNTIYNACDVLIHPTLEEGFGYAELEAFAVGLPTVVSDIPIMREICQNASIFCDPRSPDDFVLGVLNALKYRDELVSKGFARADIFSFKRFQDRVRSYYNSILSSARDGL